MYFKKMKILDQNMNLKCSLQPHYGISFISVASSLARFIFM